MVKIGYLYVVVVVVLVVVYLHDNNQISYRYEYNPKLTPCTYTFIKHLKTFLFCKHYGQVLEQ